MATDVSFLLLIFVPLVIMVALVVMFLRQKIRKDQELSIGAAYDDASKYLTAAGALHARGEHMRAIQKYQSAREKLQQAYEWSNDLGDSGLRNNVKKLRATCESDLAKCKVAIERKKIHDMLDEATLRVERGKAFRLEGDLTSAGDELSHVTEIVNMAQQIAGKYDIVEDSVKVTRVANLIREENALVYGKNKVAQTPAPAAAQRRAEEEGDLKVKSDYDYKEGFVRVLVALINMRDTVVTEAQIKLLSDEKYLRLDHIHPTDIELCGKDATVGTIGPGEKKTVEFFLDPMVCQTVNVDAQVTYKDARGKFRTAFMNQLPVGIQCPIFAESDTVNTATAVNLATHVLARKDRKIFLVPPALKPSEAFLLAKEVVQTREVRHVSDILYKKEFGAMAYYYGKTKQREQFIIRITALDETNSIELFVACDSEPMLTGELAKLAQELNERLIREHIIRQPIQQVNISIRDSVILRSNIIFKDGLAKADIEIHDSVVSRSEIG